MATVRSNLAITIRLKFNTPRDRASITMAKPNQDRYKAMRRGSPATRKKLGVWVPLRPDQLAALDQWIEKQPNPPSRVQAISRMIEIRLRSRTYSNRSKSHSKKQFRDAVKTLRAPTPISNQLKGSKNEDYSGRLVEWIIKHSKSRNAREVYNRLQVPKWILWLNEAAGESPKLIQRAKSEMKHLKTVKEQAKCVRSVLRWDRTAELLFNKRSTSRRR